MSAAEFNQLLGELAATPTRVQRLIENLSEEQLRRRPANGEFSLAESVCHLRDIEAEGYLPRIRRVLNEERPFLPDLDGGRLAIEREYNQQNANEAARAFSQARAESTHTLAGVGLAESSREGTLAGVGDISLQGLLTMMCEHDTEHLRQMTDLRREITDALC